MVVMEVGQKDKAGGGGRGEEGMECGVNEREREKRREEKRKKKELKMLRGKRDKNIFFFSSVTYSISQSVSQGRTE